MNLSPGDVVGDYEILGELGTGGMGSVYRVRHVISQREEALKVLLPDLANAPELGDRFVREIQVLARLNHPHIASLHTALRMDNRLLMIMELVDGVNLREKLVSPGIALWEGVDYICQTLEALSYAHQRGVTHRDIKPSNIIISTGGAVKLLDFGIAAGGGARRLTKTGVILGSAYYMSPEQVRGDSSDARSDVYSTGITLWEIAAGRCPFEGEGEFAIMMGHLEREPEPPADSPGVPAALWVALRKSLAKKPELRFQTAAEFRDALLALRSGASTVDVVPGTRTLPREDSPTNPALLDQVSKQLAIYIGPIAKVIVKRTATHSRSLDELYAELAKEITSMRDRDAFLAARLRRDIYKDGG